MTFRRWAVSTSLLAAVFVFLQFFTASELVPIRQSLDAFPIAAGGWRTVENTTLDDDMLRLLKLNDYLMRRYVDSDGQSLWLYIGYWETQRKGAQIHSPKNCLPGGGWEPLDSELERVAVGGSASIEVNRYVLQRGADQLLALYWFQSRGRAIAGEIDAKVELVRSAMFHRRSDGAIVRVTSPVVGSVAETSDSLVKFVQAIYPVLGRFLPD